jgi:hypothetical protein
MGDHLNHAQNSRRSRPFEVVDVYGLDILSFTQKLHTDKD